MRRPSLYRHPPGHGHHRVGFVELFFDLVFVFAITQLSHGLAAHFSLLGAAETAVLLGAVWWVWIYTSWVTNWLDPERTRVRLLLFAMMAGGLVLATSIPTAFDGRGVAFALAYVTMQVGRTLFMVVVTPAEDRRLRRNFHRILAWFLAGAVLWLGGAALEGVPRLGLWAAAVLLEMAAPALGFAVPWMGKSTVNDWKIDGGHMAERCGLFVIIALGESILVTGSTFAGQDWTWTAVAAFAVALSGSVAMWWIYFHRGAELGAARISEAADPGRLARLAYTYLHLPIVAGIVVTAVGDEVLLGHPLGGTGGKAAVALLSGPMLFLAGVMVFKRTLRMWLQPSHIAGLAALALLFFAAPWLPPVGMAAVASGVLVVVAVWEAWSLRTDGKEWA